MEGGIWAGCPTLWMLYNYITLRRRRRRVVYILYEWTWKQMGYKSFDFDDLLGSDGPQYIMGITDITTESHTRSLEKRKKIFPQMGKKKKKIVYAPHQPTAQDHTATYTRDSTLETFLFYIPIIGRLEMLCCVYIWQCSSIHPSIQFSTVYRARLRRLSAKCGQNGLIYFFLDCWTTIHRWPIYGNI
jgi:hypothetical protein